MTDKKQYLSVDKKNFRRHSAPETPVLQKSRKFFRNYIKRRNWCTASVSDFSILLEYQSDSSSSLELDTSNLSGDTTPVLTSKSTLRGSYQDLSTVDYDIHEKYYENNSSRNAFGTWLIWRNIIFSQAVAGCLAVTIICNNTIRHNPPLIINGQNLLQYIFFGALWTTKLLLRNNGSDIVEILKFSGLRYLCLAVLHVEVNCLMLSAFRYSSYLGNQTIDCIAASLSLVIAYALLEVQFHMIQISGFILTILGGLGLSVADYIHKNQTHNEMFLGDILRIASGVCVAYSSMTEEIIVKATDPVEYMGMIGLMGSVICGLQALALDVNKVLPKNLFYWSNFLIYSFAQFFFHSLTPKVLRNLGATGFHLTLISSGFYTHIIEVLFENTNFVYLLLYFAIIIGSSLFTTKKASIGTQFCNPIKIVVMKGG